MTNADRIRGMTDEELAELLAEVTDCYYCPVGCRYEDHTDCDEAFEN